MRGQGQSFRVHFPRYWIQFCASSEYERKGIGVRRGVERALEERKECPMVIDWPHWVGSCCMIGFFSL